MAGKRTRRGGRVVVIVIAIAGLGIGACSAFGGDRGGQSRADEDASMPTGDATAADGIALLPDGAAIDGTGANGDASPNEGGGEVDACVTLPYAAVADTDTNDAGCNLNVSRGNATTLEVGGPSAMVSFVRFELDDAGVGIATSPTGSARFVGYQATCSAGACSGQLHPMRSDWDEGSGTSDGADFCRSQKTSSKGWGAGATGTPIAQGVDYGPAITSINTSGGAYSTADFSTTAVAPYLADGGLVSFLIDTTGAPKATFSSREVVGHAPMLYLRQCPQ